VLKIATLFLMVQKFIAIVIIVVVDIPFELATK
jgi:hypothetical protein